MSPIIHRIEDYIPHRDRMRLANEVVEVREGACTTRCEVADSWPLCADGAVSAVLLIELVAQTASALMGWERRHVERQGGRGLLVGVKHARWRRNRLPVGTVLSAFVEIEIRRDNYVTFRGVVSSDLGEEASVRIQAFRP